MIGYSLRGAPEGPAADAIDWANAMTSPTIALDLPSGRDATTGHVGDPCIVADATLTLALPKTGLTRSAHVVGALYAADISVPTSIYTAMGMPVASPFVSAGIVRVAAKEATR